MKKKGNQFVKVSFVIVLLFLFSGLQLPPVNAGPKVSGSFTATSSCEAYQSIKKRSNPGSVNLNINARYDLLEANKTYNPDWFRLKIDFANPSARWVQSTCGRISLDNVPKIPGNCNKPGLADSYVLAVSWQPAFCETHENKPECSIDDPDAYQAKNFTLHGLWPNKASCGKQYGFCGTQQKLPKGSGFCDYPAIDFSENIFDELKKVMPSAGSGSCLQRHEWYKHGTCQTKWNDDQYFSTAISLLRQFNQSGVSRFMTDNLGKVVMEKDLYDVVDKAFGPGSHERMKIICNNGNLVDIFINLPTKMDSPVSLGELIRQGDIGFKSNCNGKFRIDTIDN